MTASEQSMMDRLRADCAALRVSLAESEAALDAIRHGNGATDIGIRAAGRREPVVTEPEQYRIMVEEMNEGAATLDEEGRILYCNRQFASLLQSAQAEIIGSSVADHTAATDVEAMRRLLSDALARRSAGEVSLMTSSGHRVLVLMAVNPLPPGSPAKVCLLVTDLTEHQKKELALLNLMEDVAETNVRLEAANREMQQQISARHQAQLEVQQLNATLEQRVRERTEQLHQSEDRVQLALQVSRSFTFAWSVVTDDVVRSPHCAEILGLTDNATHDTGRKFFECVQPEDREAFVRTVTTLSPSHPRYSIEYRVIRPDQQVLVLQESGLGSFDSDGKLIRVVGMTADVTARVTAEHAVVRLNQELKRRMVELQTILDTAPAGIAIADDPHGLHIRGNPALEKMLGVSIGAELSVTSDKVRYRVIEKSKDAPAADLPMQRACRGEVVVGQNLHILRPDGTTAILLSHAAPLRDDGGRPNGAVGVFLDVTEAKRAEEALRESELRFRNVYDTAPVSIWQEDWSDVIALVQAKRKEGVSDFAAYVQTHPEFVGQAMAAVKILDVNQWTVTMFGARDKAELLRSLTTVFATPELTVGFIDELVALASGQSTLLSEMVFTTVRGERLHGLIAMSLPPLDSGSGSVLVSVIDISKRKRAELELVKLAAELKAANKELESFAYSISHDLRAPLRSIDGFSRILLRDCATVLDEKNRENLHRVRQSSQRMGELIDDLLELSRATRGDLHFAEVDLTALINTVYEELHQAEPSRSVLCEVQRGLKITADPVLMRAVIDNLVGNAWKFTQHRPEARIEVGAMRRNGERIYFVRDNGVGFDMAYASKLFGPFQRLHTSQEFPGTGIGLATVQRILHRHGGRIWAEAAVDAGATFYFTLPTTRAS